MPLYLLFLALPLLEIWVFVMVADETGFFNAFFMLCASALIGSLIIMKQGMGALLNAKTAMERGEMPMHALLEGLAFSIAGVLLVIPGFITDFFALCLLIAPVRSLLARHFGGGARPRGDDDVIDGDFAVVEPEKREITDQRDDKDSP